MKPKTYVYKWASYEESGIYLLMAKTREAARNAFSLLDRGKVRDSDILTLDEYVAEMKKDTLEALRRIARK